MNAGSGISAAYFDQWYANMAETRPTDEIAQRHLGLPAALLSTSLLTWDGIADVVAQLRLPEGGTLLDVACGRGGYGLEIQGLLGAGFVEVVERPAWRSAERGMWEEAAALDPGDDPALRSFHDEGLRMLEWFDLVRRVMAVGTAPSAPGSRPEPAGGRPS